MGESEARRPKAQSRENKVGTRRKKTKEVEEWRRAWGIEVQREDGKRPKEVKR